MGAHQAWWASVASYPCPRAPGHSRCGLLETGVLNGQPYCLSQESRPWQKLNCSNLI